MNRQFYNLLFILNIMFLWFIKTSNTNLNIHISYLKGKKVFKIKCKTVHLGIYMFAIHIH